MGEYKRVEDVLAKLAEREEIHGLVEPKRSADAKYKKEKGNPHGPDRPTLRVGSRIVFQLYGGERMTVRGYALGVVLDWTVSEDRWWNHTDVIVQVVRVSNPNFEPMVGHLRHRSLNSWGKRVEMPLFTPEECAAKDYGL